MPASDCRASEMRRMSMPFRGCASSLWPLILLVAWAAFLASAPVTAEGSVPPTSYEEPNYLAGPEGPQLAPQHASANGGESNRSEPAEENGAERYAVAGFDFNRVATPYIISLWIIIVGLAKIGESTSRPGCGAKNARSASLTVVPKLFTRKLSTLPASSRISCNRASKPSTQSSRGDKQSRHWLSHPPFLP